MAKQTMDQVVASGVPFNPMSSDQGRAYSGKNGEKLKAAMEKNGWDDPRFLTEGQVKRLGLTLVENAKKSLVLFRESEQEPWKKIPVVNATQVVGLPSLAEMQVEARKKLGIGLTFDDLVQKGKPFNPLSGSDGQGHAYASSNLTALETAMKENGWKDPRFVTKAQIEHEKWSVKEGAPKLTVWQKGEDGWNVVPVFNATFVEGIPSIEVMQKEAAKARENQQRAAKEVAQAQQEKGEKTWVNPGPVAAEAGVVMNPLSGNAGHVYGGKNADKLLAAMSDKGWADGRFVTAKAAEYAGLTLAEGAVPVVVNFPINGQFVKTSLYNAAEVVGMPSMAAQYAGLAKLASPEHGEMALAGMPFNPLDKDAEVLVKDKETYAALMSLMDNRGWDDPRFVTPAEVAAKNLRVADGQGPATVNDGVEVYNAVQLVDFPKLPNLANWQALQDQAVVIEKERQKVKDAVDLGNAAVGDSQAQEAAAAAQGIEVPPALSVDMLGDVLAMAKDLKLKVSQEKVESLLGGQGVADGNYVGKVLAVDAEKGLVYQSQGRGRGEVLPMAALSRPISMDEVGKSIAIQVAGGRGTVAEPTVGQARGR